MRMTYLVHIVAGTLGLVAGYLALFSAKGAAVHRKSGRVFVYTMLAMAIAGMTIAVVRGKAPEVNIPAGLITSYFVITALVTVRPESALSSRFVAVALMLVALGVAVIMLTFAIEAFANGGTRQGMPAFPFVMFAAFGLLGAGGDLRVLRSGAPKGGARLARHLWRMSMALFIGALSFSVQAARILSKYMDFPRGLIALPMLAVLVTMSYWLWRVRRKRQLRGVVLRVNPVEAV
jgi:hypothetical protein